MILQFISVKLNERKNHIIMVCNSYLNETKQDTAQRHIKKAAVLAVNCVVSSITKTVA